ncbi:MAG: bifunctional diaminohydroxyphosphoribosylaminopyrimidine deaminase/5-amino-6-(5-phosphoribosylamino)uracil reductase RibD [Planctomycetota bacterium]|nr:MAG: bifunctional diaminohydroxyphosphoribosylaminopyrimidine deaminase/5-amino-6-(5-phosphoribosylamino)uracil reductase RibD [Planctomycetota bacterium]
MTVSLSPVDHRWMRLALRQAAVSLGATAPNPGVGCVLVRNGQVLGSGRHRRCGGPHAEPEALNDCQQRGHDPRGATVYVTLAPCTRHGRTPPCTQALIQAGVARVVAALADPLQDDPQALFSQAGIAYEVGCEAPIAQHIHGGWLKRVTQGRPRVTGKWAASLDGFLGPAAARQQWLSSPSSQAISRRRRSAFDAIVVGAETVAVDDCRLLATGSRHPRRVVISARGRLPVRSALVTSMNQAPVWLIHDDRAAADHLCALRDLGVGLMPVADAHDVDQVLQALAAAGCNDILVEGGAQVHGAMLAAQAYDRLELYQSSLSLGHGRAISNGPQRQQSFVPEIPPRLSGNTVVSHWLRVDGGGPC